MLVTALLICTSSALTHSQVSTNVPVTDDTYRDLDRLTAFGLLDDYIYGLRPYCRSEVARLVADARKRLHIERSGRKGGQTAGMPVDALEQTLVKLENLFSSDIHSLDTKAKEQPLEVEVFRNFMVEQNYLDSPSRPVPVDIRYGEINADINPLYGHHDGKRFVQGANSYLQFQNRLRAFGFLALEFVPYLYLGVPKGSVQSQAEVFVQHLSLKASLRNFELQIGRDQVVWGQGEAGGMLLSNNPRPFDLVKFSTVHPIRLPGILRHIGPSEGSIFVARLGKNRNFPHTALVGFAVSSRPISSIEVGLFHTYLFGGTGAPKSDFLDPIAEFFFIRRHGEAFERPDSPNLADHRAGVQFRYDAAALRHSQFYLEWVWDDFLLKILHTSAFLVGVHVPRLDFSGRTGLRIEFRSLARIFYRHSDFRTGYAEDGWIIGDPLGPKALALSLGLTHRINTHVSFESRVSYEDRRGTVTGTANLDGTHERRIRSSSALRVRLSSGWSIKTSAGYEHVWRFNFEQERERNNVLLELTVELPF